LFLPKSHDVVPLVGNVRTCFCVCTVDKRPIMLLLCSSVYVVQLVISSLVLPQPVH